MPAALSLDLRVRVLVAVAQGLSHRAAGDRFGVSAASVSRWRALERAQGDARARRLGGDRRSGRIEAHRDMILAMIKETPDMAIGVKRSRRRIWLLVTAQSGASSPATKSRVKKDRARGRAGPA